MARRPLDTLLAAVRRPRRKPVMVIVQTEKGQVAMPADALRDRLRVR